MLRIASLALPALTALQAPQPQSHVPWAITVLLGLNSLLKTRVQTEAGRLPKVPAPPAIAPPVRMDCKFMIESSACVGGIKNYCEPGYYCTLGNPTSSVTACPVGKYQPYNRQSLASECLDCPAGHYCQSTAMHTPTPCGAGFYNSNTGSSAPTDCVECDAGSVC